MRTVMWVVTTVAILTLAKGSDYFDAVAGAILFVCVLSMAIIEQSKSEKR